MRSPHHRLRGACLALACGIASALAPAAASGAELVYIGPVNQQGTGLGNVATVLSVGNH